MKKQGRNNKQDEVEDWCFVCKDGGELRLCDYVGCTKVYHPKCVNRKNSFLQSKKRWICDHHSCSSCCSRTKIGFSCLLCTYSLCDNCRKSSDGSEFAVVRGNENSGLCEDCLELVRLAEDNAEYDGDGDKLDFEDPNTFESGLKECWEILKDKQGLTFDGICQERKEMIDEDEIPLKQMLRSVNEEDDEEDDTILIALHKRKKRKLVISDYETSSDSEDNEPHLKNEIGEDDEDEITREDQDHAARRLHKKPKLVISSDLTYYSGKKIEETEEVVYPNPTSNAKESCFASVVASNIKLVYLRRSLVEKLMLKQPNWERKVVGSYVRVKNDPDAFFPGNFSHQLTQVKGITRKQDGKEILLQLLTRDVPITLLSDDDFTEEECQELRERVENYQVRRPTVVEIEHKARELQVDLTNDWIEREFIRLMKCIRPETNQNGWISKELSKYWELTEMLKQISEQERQFQQKPQVIAEVLDLSNL